MAVQLIKLISMFIISFLFFFRSTIALKDNKPVPNNVSPKLDCAIKEFAWNYSKKLQPNRGNFLSVFDALQLQTNCNITRPSKNIDVKTRRSTPFIDLSSNVVFVHSTKGLDKNNGREERPVASLLAARNLCRQYRKVENDHCTIYLMEGVHELKETLHLGPEDSGTSFVGDNAIISGGKTIKPEWKLYKNTMQSASGQNAIFYDGLKPGESSKSVMYMSKINSSATCLAGCNSDVKCTAYVFLNTDTFKSMCYFRFDGLWNPEPQNNCVSGKKITIYSTDLRDSNIKPFNSLFIDGRRAVRARFPNGNPETTGIHTTPTGYVTKALSWLPAKPSPPAVEIQIKNPYRSHNQFPIFQLGIDGSVKQFHPPESYWATKEPYGGVTYKVPSGLVYNKSLEMSVNEWKRPETGIVHAYMHYHWGGWQFQLDSRNMSSNTLKWSKGGFQEARGDTGGAEWYVENIFEELDVAGEWYFDDETYQLYYFPNGSLPEEVTISQVETLISIKGYQSNPFKNISFSHLTFTETSSTFLESYEVPSGGDWSIHRNGALFIEGGENVVVESCLFTNIGGNALFLSNYIRDAIISNNEFVWIGDSAIAAIGSSNLIDGTDGNQPRRTKILNNLVHEIGLFGKQTAAYVQSLACETLVERNVFFNGPRAGINFNDGFGGGNVVTKNLLFNFVRETLDHGPFNSWDRQPYLTRVRDDKNASLVPKENTMTYNFIISNYHSCWPIDHDDGTGYFTDQYNYLVYGGFKNYLGHSKTSQYNVYVYPDGNQPYSKPCCAFSSGAQTGPLASGWGDRYTDNKCIVHSTQVYEYPSCKVQDINQLIPYTARNKFYTPDAQIVFKCDDNTWTLKEYQERGFDIGSTVSDLVDTNEIIQWGKDLLL
ncbi:uncharacterized protein LOC114528250 [Dendronephthya gigantea]|uniref:uncharacterized protein LOC114528250 n=1 Tax=Dendronephthya gigantea TaxID=151771 RepID=UPI00106AA9A1|nr:uncharacterized protein LOC114528250 [Dendronephthya gigantea]